MDDEVRVVSIERMCCECCFGMFDVVIDSCLRILTSASVLHGKDPVSTGIWGCLPSGVNCGPEDLFVWDEEG